MCLKDASDAKLTVDGRSFHTSQQKNLLREAHLDRGPYRTPILPMNVHGPLSEHRYATVSRSDRQVYRSTPIFNL